MGGHEFHDNIINDENFNDIPFLLLTARTIEHEKIESLAKGAIDYIYKPFIIKELLEKIRAIIRNRKANIRKTQNKKISSDKTADNDEQRLLVFERFCKKYKISRMEKWIILELINGLQAKEIAAKQNKSIHTVRNHIRHVYGKCKVQNRIELYNMIFETK